MKTTSTLVTDIRIRLGKVYDRERKTRTHRCERRKVREAIHRWDPTMEDESQ